MSTPASLATDDDPTAEPPDAPTAGGLFYLAGATDGTLQWKAERFQLVNWGGFEGRVQFDLHPGATLLSGASGTGKSTILDAYIALMMPSDTAFNGASNDAVAGRARSGDQRNLLSYLRGKTDTVADAKTGREVDQLLRGNGVATWGAVGMTFINDNGGRFTAFRVYHVPAGATSFNEIKMRMATFDGSLDLADLAPLAAQSFQPTALKAAISGLRTYETYSAFASTLHTRLGIGANGDGAKALRLLVRIQSGHQIRTVDEMYKEMVLERPATYVAADRAIQHFDDLEAAYLAMQSEQAKAELLSPITERHQTRLNAKAEQAAFDTFGVAKPGDTPVVLWRLRTEEHLLHRAVEANRTARIAVADQLRQAKPAENTVVRELDATKEAHRREGGGLLEQMTSDLAELEFTAEDRRRRRQELADRITALARPLATKQDFDDLRANATSFLQTYEQQRTATQDRRDAVLTATVPLSTRRTDLRDERTSREGRAGRVPRQLDDLRRAAAAAAGMQPEDLPFVAELIDLAPDEARWRIAIETVLGASARTMLVPLNELEAFSRAIDPLRLPGRLSFEGARHSAPQPFVGDPERIAGKLLFQDSPFSAWVQDHLSQSQRNLRCVERSDMLAGAGGSVTLAGQTRQGNRGAHGRNAQANIIGFSSAEALAEIEAELDAIERQLAVLDEQRRAADDELKHLERTVAAYEAVNMSSWQDIDVADVETRIADLTARRRQILASDDQLRALAEHVTHLTGQLEQLQSARYGLEARTTVLDEEHESLVDQQDVVSEQLHRIDAEQRIRLDDAQTERLDLEFARAAAPRDPMLLADFSANLARLSTQLLAALETARSDADRAEADLLRIFGQYQQTWEDPNLGQSVESYPDYALILDNIVSTGLHERRNQWRQRLTEWSGQDLVPLAGEMDNSVRDIEDRLKPINAILSGLDFGATQDRLRIHLRRLTHEHVTQFNRELRKLSSGATKDVPEHKLEGRFKDLQRFMAQMRKRDDPRTIADLSDRDRLLDVRRHVEITAERVNATGDRLSTYTALGGKSGGESQELVAFIVGAALRFRLGDDDRVRPRFAPVFLDEGFVKSDAEFAGRAVRVWKGLGFQLIVGAPLDKVTALEPHMDEMLAITKNTQTRYSFVHRIEDPTARPSDPAA